MPTEILYSSVVFLVFYLFLEFAIHQKFSGLFFRLTVTIRTSTYMID